MKKVFALLAVLALTGCTHYTLTKEQCSGDWHLLGLQDGSDGYAIEPRLADHALACDRHQLKINRKAYLVGWNKGILQYCTPAMGFVEGKRGYTYEKVCPRHLEPAFLAEYSRGFAIYRVRSRYQSLLEDLDHVQDRLADKREDLAKAKKEEDRVSLTRDINRLEEDREEASRQVRLYEMKHAQNLID